MTEGSCPVWGVFQALKVYIEELRGCSAREKKGLEGGKTQWDQGGAQFFVVLTTLYSMLT